MRQGAWEAHVIVTVEQEQAVRFHHWRGSSPIAIRRAAKRAYPEARLRFGNAWWTVSYGAH